MQLILREWDGSLKYAISSSLSINKRWISGVGAFILTTLWHDLPCFMSVCPSVNMSQGARVLLKLPEVVQFNLDWTVTSRTHAWI